MGTSSGTAEKTRREALLDAAERLFAASGYDGVSMRMVADAATVSLGLLTYHFTTKDLLFDAVVGRRATILTTARKEALARIEAPTLEALLEAFIAPYCKLIVEGDPGWRAYARLQAMITQDARWTALADQYFGNLARDMVEHIMRCEPELTREQAVRGYAHLIGTMISVFAATGLVDRLSDGAVSSDDIQASYMPMVRFSAGGIRALRGSAQDEAESDRRKGRVSIGLHDHFD